MKYLIRHMLKEESDIKFFRMVSDKMKTGKISPPFFKKFNGMGLSDQEIESIMEYFFDGDIKIEGKIVFNSNNDLIYYESWDSTKWELILYNKFNKMTYREDHRGRKEMREDHSPAGKEIIPNKIVVHKSNPMFRDSILEEGLKVRVGECYQIYVNREQRDPNKIKCKPVIFATNSTKKRDLFDSTYDDDIWEINTEMIPDVKWYVDRHYGSKSKHIVTYQDIPREAITLIYEGTGESEDLIEESMI